MAILNIDLSAGDKLIPEGDVHVVVEKVEAKQSNTSDYANLRWTCVITEGPHKDEKVFLTTSTKPDAIWKLTDTLQALGVYEAGMQVATDDASNLVIQPRLAGLPAIATIEHRVWEGRTRSGIKTLKGVGGNGASPNGGSQFR